MSPRSLRPAIFEAKVGLQTGASELNHTLFKSLPIVSPYDKFGFILSMNLFILGKSEIFYISKFVDELDLKRWRDKENWDESWYPCV